MKPSQPTKPHLVEDLLQLFFILGHQLSPISAESTHLGGQIQVNINTDG